MDNTQVGGWTDLQTVINFRNALRGEVLKGYNSLPLQMWTVSFGKMYKTNGLVTAYKIGHMRVQYNRLVCICSNVASNIAIDY